MTGNVVSAKAYNIKPEESNADYKLKTVHFLKNKNWNWNKLSK